MGGGGGAKEGGRSRCCHHQNNLCPRDSVHKQSSGVGHPGDRCFLQRPLAETPGNPRPLSGQSLTGPALSSGSRATQLPLTHLDRAAFRAGGVFIYILIKSGFKPPGSPA